MAAENRVGSRSSYHGVLAATGDRWNYRPGYGYGPGPVTLTYNVQWNIPVEWLPGSCQVEVRLSAGGGPSTWTSSPFTLLIQPLGATNVSPYINPVGIFTQTLTASSADGWGRATMTTGTRGLIRGQALSEISINRITTLPPPPADTTLVGRAYTFGPEEAVFDPSATIGITYDPAEVPAGAAETRLVMAVRNAATGGWDTLISNVDPANHAVAAPATRFGVFSLLVPTRPAAFAVSNLSVAPAAVDIGKVVAVSVTVNNTGDLSGLYTVTLKIDNAAAASQDLTLAGKAGQKVSFNVTRSTAGTYAVEVDGLAGTFTVTPAPTPTPKPTPTSSPTPTAKPTPTPTTSPTPTPTPKPTPTPAPKLPTPPPPPAEVDWGPIIIGIVAPAAIFLLGVWLIIDHLRHK